MFFFQHAGRRHTLPSSLRTEVLRETLGQIDRYLSLRPEERLQTDVRTVWKRPLEGDAIEALTTLSYVGRVGQISLARAEFGGVLYLLHRRLLAALGRRQASIPRLPSTWRELFARAGFSRELDEARQRLQTEDDGLQPEAPMKLFEQKTGAALTRVEIRNFKSLEFIDFKMPEGMAPATTSEYTDLTRAPCLLILGENATGKSSILEAMALTATSDELRQSLVPEAGKLRLNPVYMGGVGSPAPDASSAVLPFGEIQLGLSISDEGLRPDGTATRPLVFAYGARRLFGKRRRSGDLRHIDTLFENDRQLSNPEPWLIELEKGRPQNLNEVMSALRHNIQIDGEFQNIEVAREGRKRRCYINIRKTRPDGSTYLLRQRLDAASLGYRAVLALVCDIFQGLMENSPVVSIDEGGGSYRAEASRATERRDSAYRRDRGSPTSTLETADHSGSPSGILTSSAVGLPHRAAVRATPI